MAHTEAMGLKFIHSKFDGLDGKTKSEWATEGRELVLTADQEAVVIKGTLRLTTQMDLQGFAKLLSDVWSEHRKLTPRIMRTPTDG